MNGLFQDAFETILKTMTRDMIVYGLAGLVVAGLIDGIFQKDDRPTKEMLFVEIFLQLFAICFVYMLCDYTFPSRYGLLAYVVMVVATLQSMARKLRCLTDDIGSGPDDDRRDDDRRLDRGSAKALTKKSPPHPKDDAPPTTAAGATAGADDDPSISSGTSDGTSNTTTAAATATATATAAATATPSTKISPSAMNNLLAMNALLVNTDAPSEYSSTPSPEVSPDHLAQMDYMPFANCANVGSTPLSELPSY